MEKSPAKEQLESLACVCGGKICSSAIEAAHGVTLREKPLLIAALAPPHYFAARRFPPTALLSSHRNGLCWA